MSVIPVDVLQQTYLGLLVMPLEKMGELMSGRLLGLYDKLTSFLTQINLFRSRGLSDSHEIAFF